MLQKQSLHNTAHLYSQYLQKKLFILYGITIKF